MEQFEYMREDIGWSIPNVRRLNELGKLGWKLVSVITIKEAKEQAMLFVRTKLNVDAKPINEKPPTKEANEAPRERFGLLEIE